MAPPPLSSAIKLPGEPAACFIASKALISAYQCSFIGPMKHIALPASTCRTKLPKHLPVEIDSQSWAASRQASQGFLGSAFPRRRKGPLQVLASATSNLDHERSPPLRVQEDYEAYRDNGAGSTSGDSYGKKKVVVVGAGWAGLGAAHHLSKQGYDVTLLEAGPQPGGLVAGWKTPGGKSVEVGIHGFWYPYRNIFALTDELGLKPFTEWTTSSQYSPAGLEVESPIFQEMPRLPSPLGTFVWTQFKRLPLADRLTALPLMYAVVDFDNSDEAWRRYDKLTARELFRQYGCSERVYSEAFNPMLLVGLFAPGEQCSAAATLGMLYYFILAHQRHGQGPHLCAARRADWRAGGAGPLEQAGIGPGAG